MAKLPGDNPFYCVYFIFLFCSSSRLREPHSYSFCVHRQTEWMLFEEILKQYFFKQLVNFLIQKLFIPDHGFLWVWLVNNVK